VKKEFKIKTSPSGSGLLPGKAKDLKLGNDRDCFTAKHKGSETQSKYEEQRYENEEKWYNSCVCRIGTELARSYYTEKETQKSLRECINSERCHAPLFF
jgi:hypothetical protein